MTPTPDTPTPAGLTAVEAALDDFASALRDATYEDANVFALTSRREMLNAVAEEERVAVLDAVRAALDAATAAREQAERENAELWEVVDDIASAMREPMTLEDARRARTALVRSYNAMKKAAARPTDAEARHGNG